MNARTDHDSVLDLFDNSLGEDLPTDPAGPGGGGPAAAPPADDEARRRRRKLLAWLLAVVLLLVGALAAWYLLTRKPITQLPGTNLVAMPTYKTAIYDVKQPLGVAVTPDGSTIYVTHGGVPATAAGSATWRCATPATVLAAWVRTPMSGPALVTARMPKARRQWPPSGVAAS